MTADEKQRRMCKHDSEVKMSSNDACALLNAVKWSDQGLTVEEFSKKVPLPQIARVIKGQYKGIGVPSLGNPGLNQTVLLTNAMTGSTRVKVVAQCIKYKETTSGRRMIPVGPIVAVPDSFDGWFEILSEDGRPMRCIESVAELVRRFPDTCVVREKITAHVINTAGESSGKITDKTRIINRGETLVLVSEVSGSHFQTSKSSNGQNNKFLRCFDVNGESIYLGLEQTGKFSPVAGHENISGVHTIKNLLAKRMPITVKMVHGNVPGGVLKNCSNQSSPEMRLLGIIHEDCIMALPLAKDLPSCVIPVPLCAGLKLQAPRNNDELRKMPEYSRIVEKCSVLGRDSADQMHVLDMSSKSKDIIQVKNSYTRYGGHSNIHQYFGSIHNQIKKLNDGGKNKPELSQRRGSQKPINKQPDPPKQGDSSRYEEIDIIYDYVRGFGPLPKSISKEFDKMDDPKKPKTKPVKSTVTPKSPKTQKPPIDKQQTERKIPTEASKDKPREPSPAKTASLPVKKPKNESVKKPEPTEVPKEDSPPEPPPIETIPVRRSCSMPNATATNIVVSGADVNTPKTPKDQLNMTDNVAYSNFVPPTKDNVYDKVTHEHEGFTIDLKSPSLANQRGRAKKGTVASNNKTNKLFIKSQTPSKSHRPRLFKHSISTPAPEKSPITSITNAPAPRKTIKSPKTRKKGDTVTKNPTPSPIFNLRYKSLTDLAIDFDTLDSSNSGGRVSEGSADLVYPEKGSKTQLPRPKSLTNLVWPANQVDCVVQNNKTNNCGKQYNNIMSNLFHNNKVSKKHSSPNGVGPGRKMSDGVLIYGRNKNHTHAHKRLSALYL